jgi:hypothetical protein
MGGELQKLPGICCLHHSTAAPTTLLSDANITAFEGFL